MFGFLGELPDGRRVEAVVTGDRDPDYGSTSKMIAESALCLVRDAQAVQAAASVSSAFATFR